MVSTDAFKEASALISGKTVLHKRVFDKLLPEFRAWAFTVTGMDDFDAMQRVRDVIATVPLGGDWGAAKAIIADELAPWLPGDAADERAETLLRTHAYQAYAAMNFRVLEEMVDVFPYRQYMTANDGRVRATHQALNGIILPATHPWWKKHTPPWEYKCRCDVVGLSLLDVEGIRAEEKHRPLSKRLILEGAVLRKLEQDKILERGYVLPEERTDDRKLNMAQYNTATPKERGNGVGYEWEAGTVGMKMEDVLVRYTGETRREFLEWAGDTLVLPGMTVLEWLKSYSGIQQFN
jgi:SPP1 gp7 family putative phage head morphogenesis protein